LYNCIDFLYICIRKICLIGNVIVNQNETIAAFVSESMLGKVVDPFGRIIDISEDQVQKSSNKESTKVSTRPIEMESPSFSSRALVIKPLQTGVRSIDTTLSIVMEQRMLINGDRKTGKTSLTLSILKNQVLQNKNLPNIQKLFFLYVAIDKKISEMVGIYRLIKSWNCIDDVIIAMSKANDPASLVYISPFSTTTIAEILEAVSSITLFNLTSFKEKRHNYFEELSNVYQSMISSIFAGKSIDYCRTAVFIGSNIVFCGNFNMLMKKVFKDEINQYDYRQTILIGKQIRLFDSSAIQLQFPTTKRFTTEEFDVKNNAFQMNF